MSDTDLREPDVRRVATIQRCGYVRVRFVPRPPKNNAQPGETAKGSKP